MIILYLSIQTWSHAHQFSSNAQEKSKHNNFEKQATSTVLVVGIRLTALEIHSLLQLQQARFMLS